LRRRGEEEKRRRGEEEKRRRGEESEAGIYKEIFGQSSSTFVWTLIEPLKYLSKIGLVVQKRTFRS